MNEKGNGCLELLAMGLIFGLIFIFAQLPIFWLTDYFSPFKAGPEDDSEDLFHAMDNFMASIGVNFVFSISAVILLYVFIKSRDSKN